MEGFGREGQKGFLRDDRKLVKPVCRPSFFLLPGRDAVAGVGSRLAPSRMALQHEWRNGEAEHRAVAAQPVPALRRLSSAGSILAAKSLSAWVSAVTGEPGPEWYLRTGRGYFRSNASKSRDENQAGLGRGKCESCGRSTPRLSKTRG